MVPKIKLWTDWCTTELRGVCVEPSTFCQLDFKNISPMLFNTSFSNFNSNSNIKIENEMQFDSVLLFLFNIHTD
jgi:hypothetical protein